MMNHSTGLGLSLSFITHIIRIIIQTGFSISGEYAGETETGGNERKQGKKMGLPAGDDSHPFDLIYLQEKDALRFQSSNTSGRLLRKSRGI